MSDSTTTNPRSEADLLEKIKLAELESNSSIEHARREAEKIVSDEKERASLMILKAEESSRVNREQSLASGREIIRKELQVIKDESSRQVTAVRDGTNNPPNVEKLVLSILEV